MIATALISRIGVFDGNPSTRCAARSAKKMWRSDFDTDESISGWNKRASSARPASNGSFADAATASMIAIGAGYSLNAARAVLRANCSSASRFGSLTRRSRMRGSGLAGSALRATTAACATPMAAGSRSWSTTLSNSGDFANIATGSGSPESITFNAPSTPMMRGRRCVPPAPGRMPSFTSGRPTLALESATR